MEETVRIGEYDFPNDCYRIPSVLELERLMTIPDGYIIDVQSVAKINKIKAIGLSITVDVISHLHTFRDSVFQKQQKVL